MAESRIEEKVKLDEVMSICNMTMHGEKRMQVIFQRKNLQDLGIN